MVSASVGRDQASGNFPEGPGQVNHAQFISTITGPETGVPTLPECVVLHMADQVCTNVEEPSHLISSGQRSDHSHFDSASLALRQQPSALRLSA